MCRSPTGIWKRYPISCAASPSAAKPTSLEVHHDFPGSPPQCLFPATSFTFERRASENTCDSYAYAFKLLLVYASEVPEGRPVPNWSWNRSTHLW